MKKIHLLCLILCCSLPLCSNLFAADADPLAGYSGEQKNYYRWGEDVLIAAPYSFGVWHGRGSFGTNFDGVMFPIYLGYLSFDDQGSEKSISFTPNNDTGTRSLNNIFINTQDGTVIFDPHLGFVTLDDPNFGVVLWVHLHFREIREIMRLPLGTAQNYDFAFKEQIEFHFEEAKSRLNGPESITYYLWGFTEDNFIMTPKQ